MEGKTDLHLILVLSARALVCLLALGSACLAVSSKVTHHDSSSELLKGETKNVVISSPGTIQLGRAAQVLIEKFDQIDDVWSINSIVVSGGTIYLGTSPNGGIYKYSLDRLKKIYPVGTGKNTAGEQTEQTNESNAAEARTVQAEKHLANEHIFAMATDVSGRLLAGISGEKCRLCRYEADKMEMVFEPPDARYIFAMAIDEAGNIYLGTGPTGKVYKLDPSGKEPQLIYDAEDKNILSIRVGEDGFVYAGSDTRGLVYKINPRTKKTEVLYDSDQPEITAILLTEDGDLLAAATSAKITPTQRKFTSPSSLAGRPETKADKGQERAGNREYGLNLKIANTKKPADEKTTKLPSVVRKVTRPAQASYIYKITKDGFVTNIFSEMAVFFCLAQQNEKLLVGTGNNGRLYTVEPASEQQAIIYEDQQASQITAVTVVGEDVYLGTANPAKLVKLGSGFASEGTYISDLVDAGQPAKWGKLQIDAYIPKDCKVLMASRSGNVKDVNDPTFSDWTRLVEVTKPVQLRCPLGRFCQYKLVLQTTDGKNSPVVREIAVASSIPNLAPKVESVRVSRLTTATKKGVLKISYQAKDDNADKLIYRIDFRKVARVGWIKLKDELESGSFEWDGKTVEDGRYEVRVTASDERSNTPTTGLTGSRISEPVVIDNTGPVIGKHAMEKNNQTITLKVQVSDELSAIGKVDYTVDSNARWIRAIPDDAVYDTTKEDFTMVIKKLPPGQHVIALRISDDLGNTTYKTYEVNM